jgi:O-methyltransferase
MDWLYRLAQSAASALGYNLELRLLKDSGFPSYVDPAFVALLQKYRDKTMVPWGGLYMAYKAAQYVARNQIVGDIVECGVWRGGCSLLMAEAIQQVRGPVYDFHLYDTYGGMTKPGAEDRSAMGHASTFYDKAKKSNGTVGWCYASIEEVTQNIGASTYPLDRFHLVKGRVEETIPAQAPERIALLRIDTDWYESTRHEMVHLLPRLSSGGVLLCDDYGFWEGAQKAVDEYLRSWNEPFLLTVDTGTGRAIGIRR